MELRFAIVSAHPRRDWQSARLAAACGRLGETEVFRPTDIGLSVRAAVRAAVRVAVRAGVGKELSVTAKGRDAREFDAWILARSLGHRGDPDFQCGAYRSLEELGLPVLNPVDALLRAEDKIETSFILARAGVPTPPMRAVQQLPEARAALRELGRAVAKPPYGSLGLGIMRIDHGDRHARDKLEGLLARHGVVYLQAWVGREPAEDLRVFVVGGQVAAAMARRAPDGDFRTNIFLGGEARVIRPRAEVARIAVSAARALGLVYAGVDLIDGDDGPTVIEVNGTPAWRALFDASGRDMADTIAAHAARLAQRARPAKEARA